RNQWVPRNMVLGTLEEITLAEEGTDSEGEVVALAALGAPKWSREVFGKYVSKEIGVESHDKIVKRKNDKKLNAVTLKDVYPLPRIEETLARLEGSAFFSIMDLQSGYCQVSIRESDRPKSAFITADGLYQFKVMAFGLCAAPVYLDDIIVYSQTVEEHVKRLRSVFECLKFANLKVKLKKCLFAQTRLQALGHVVDKDGIASDPEKICA
ncbi:Uncharacterized protein APZ42_009171, partial [Daphnia magna]